MRTESQEEPRNICPSLFKPPRLPAAFTELWFAAATRHMQIIAERSDRVHAAESTIYA